MRVLFVSAECYPAAKVGGLADVVGALPKYFCSTGVPCDVIMPRYHNDWILGKEVEEVFQGGFHLGWDYTPFSVLKTNDPSLGYDLYFIDIPGKFDRPGVYADPHGGYYGDEMQRNISFQRAVLDYLVATGNPYNIIHCHDHHTGLIPFFMSHGLAYQSLAATPSVFTIHNGGYQGWYPWDAQYLLPAYRSEFGGLLEWSGSINSLASAVRSAWHWTSVSNSYIDELTHDGFGLTWVYNHERWKSSGIVNGIDTEAWNPKTDKLLEYPLKRSVKKFKSQNKEWICKQLELNPDLPLHIFIGRMVYDKGVDFLLDLFYHYLSGRKDIQVIILGSGDGMLEDRTRSLEHMFPDHVRAMIMYNEQFAHQLYASSDFIWMPSRFEPCGLNQMYAMNYGTVPVVRATGGLRDTVWPYMGETGNGFLIQDLQLEQGFGALAGCNHIYWNPELLSALRERNISRDFSWENSANKYITIYKNLLNI